MRGSKLQSFIFASVVGIVIGVTAWSVYSREPWRFKVKPIQTEVKVEDEVEKDDKEDKKKTKTERMIESGALSDHPAMYYKKLE